MAEAILPSTTPTRNANTCTGCDATIPTGKHLHYCRIDQEWQGYFDGTIIVIKPRSEKRAAEDALNDYVYDLISDGLIDNPWPYLEPVLIPTAAAAGFAAIREMEVAA